MPPRTRGRPKTAPYGAMCRSYGHIWLPYTVNFYRREKAYHATLRCDRCGTERSQWFTSTGHVYRNSYRYQPGYQNKAPADQRPSRDDYRLLNLVNLDVREVESDDKEE